LVTQSGLKSVFGGGGTINVDGNELRWYPPVTKAEANRLATFLKNYSLFEQRTGLYMELRRSDGEVYELHFPVSDGTDQDDKGLVDFMLLGLGLSEQVFRGQPVDIYLCDQNMKTLRVLTPRWPGKPY
jgi:hypothetical protein